jgi:hypothetical protein
LAVLLGVREIRTFFAVDHPIPGWLIALALIALTALVKSKLNHPATHIIKNIKEWPAIVLDCFSRLPAPIIPGTVLFGEVLIFFRRPLFSSTVGIPFDMEGYHLPLASFIAKSLRNAEFPLWDPYSYCGVPIYANLQAQLFYPPA